MLTPDPLTRFVLHHLTYTALLSAAVMLAYGLVIW